MPDGDPVEAGATVRDLARLLVNDDRASLPVADKAGTVIGALDRREALDILLGAEA